MHHLGTHPLQTPRLTLRRHSLDDCHAMYENWANDPAVTKFLRWQPHRDWTETAEILHEWEKHYPEPDFYQWGICLADGTLIGSISILPAEERTAAFAVDPALPAPYEAGYCIGRAWWGRGYTTEALCAVRDYWFGAVGAPWLICAHAVQNPASGRVMQKAGFRYDHDAFYTKFDGTAVPCRCYRLLQEEL